MHISRAFSIKPKYPHILVVASFIGFKINFSWCSFSRLIVDYHFPALSCLPLLSSVCPQGGTGDCSTAVSWTSGEIWKQSHGKFPPHLSCSRLWEVQQILPYQWHTLPGDSIIQSSLRARQVRRHLPLWCT